MKPVRLGLRRNLCRDYFATWPFPDLFYFGIGCPYFSLWVRVPVFDVIVEAGLRRRSLITPEGEKGEGFK